MITNLKKHLLGAVLKQMFAPPKKKKTLLGTGEKQERQEPISNWNLDLPFFYYKVLTSTLYAHHPLFCFAFFQIVMVSFLFITYASFAEPFVTLELVHM